MPKRSPLDACHREAGARMVEFAGWELPVQFGGVVEEHRAVRSAAGLFDVSHMGELEVSGPGALDLLDRATPNHVAKLDVGQAHYSSLLTDAGTFIDDLLVYRLEAERFLVVVNAANVEADRERLEALAGGAVEVRERSGDYALLALQGPEAEAILAPLTATDLPAIRYYRFAVGEVAGRRAIVSRTGYTGEDGFELYVAPGEAPDLWREILAAGADRGLRPAGLGARDTLRLEAGMALYGHEIDRQTTPWEARLGWTVKLDKGDFAGREALAAQKQSGVERRLVGFELSDRGIARQGDAVWIDGAAVGRVTSGTWSPTFEKALGMAYVPAGRAEPGTEVELEVRRRRLAGTLTATPFYRRG